MSKKFKVFKPIKPIKEKYQDFIDKPTPPIIEKINAFFTVLLALISTVLAFLTFNQQQDIKGMSDLLKKQDILVSKQDKLISTLVTISAQNSSMIGELKTSEKLTAMQLDAVNDHIDANNYATKPLMNKNGMIYLSKTNNDSTYKIAVGFKNSGLRAADNVKVKIVWTDIRSNKILLYNFTAYTFPESFLPGEENHAQMFARFNQSQVIEFQNAYIVVIIEYDDSLASKKERRVFIGKQFKVDEERISTTFVEGQDRKRLNDYIKLIKL